MPLLLVTFLFKLFCFWFRLELGYERLNGCEADTSSSIYYYYYYYTMPRTTKDLRSLALGVMVPEMRSNSLRWPSPDVRVHRAGSKWGPMFPPFPLKGDLVAPEDVVVVVDLLVSTLGITGAINARPSAELQCTLRVVL